MWFAAGGQDDARAGLETETDYVFSCDLRWRLLDPSITSTTRYLTIYLVEKTAGETLPLGSQVNAETATKTMTYPITKGQISTERVSFPFRLASTTTKFGIYILSNRTGSEFAVGDFIEMCNVMLQKGVRPTPWVPSLTDVLDSGRGQDRDLVCKMEQLNRKTRISGNSFGPTPLSSSTFPTSTPTSRGWAISQSLSGLTVSTSPTFSTRGTA